ncbi:AraC family transcriptional regulator [Sinimarinibacterium thermocellulolyticum]|uniref:AraC family transcriptional regulator n=1 Tax=Sinimarinibacterium thermocellulolyticum TaxID=3170016 RepID=A0ABV2A9E4_9GAMM
MSGNFLPSATLHGAAGLLATLGGDPLRLAAELRIPADALRKPDLPLSARAVGGFLERAAEVSGCRSFGLRLAARSNMAILGPLWLLLRNAASVRQMFEDLAAHYDIFTSAATVTLEAADGGLFVGWDTAVAQAGGSVQAVEFVLALFCNELRLRCTPGWQPPLLQFRHAAPARLDEHRRVFGPRLQFDAERNALFLDAQTLAQPGKVQDSRARTLVAAMLRLDHDRPDPDLAARVEGIVRALLPYAACSLHDVSRVLGMAARTLQEHLAGEGRRFKTIRDAVRADLALKYLQQSSLSLSEIADILGYTSLSSFSHSFRRWHGQPASALRRRQGLRLARAPLFTTRHVGEP